MLCLLQTRKADLMTTDHGVEKVQVQYRPLLAAIKQLCRISQQSASWVLARGLPVLVTPATGVAVDSDRW